MHDFTGIKLEVGQYISWPDRYRHLEIGRIVKLTEGYTTFTPGHYEEYHLPEIIVNVVEEWGENPKTRKRILNTPCNVLVLHPGRIESDTRRILGDD